MSRRMGRVVLVEDYECVAYALAAVLSASAHGLEVERPAGFSSTVLEKAEEFRRRRTARLLAGRAGLA